MQQEQQMGGGGGGGGEPTRRLARFQSAPATWFDTLLQDDELLTQNQCLSQVLVNSSTIPNIRNPDNYSSAEADPTFFDQGIGAPSFGFLRHNSSPADFLAQLNSASSVGSDGDLSSFGVSSNYDYLALPDVQTNKCARESDPEQAVAQSSANFSSQERGEQSVSLPGGMASISDMEMERLFSDSVPCRVRAKRGCATHPRSIAERVRRTRISDRIRKLQELVPNMDKQTNTADMLEEAVEYVKLLQKQIQELSELQRKCKCIGRD